MPDYTVPRGPHVMRIWFQNGVAKFIEVARNVFEPLPEKKRFWVHDDDGKAKLAKIRADGKFLCVWSLETFGDPRPDFGAEYLV